MPAAPLFPSVEVAGIKVAVTSPAEACSRVLDESQRVDNTGRAVHLVNSYTISLAVTKDSYGELIRNAHCNLPDGRPLSLIMRAKNERANQVRGPRLMSDILDQGRSRDTRHFLLGGTPETLCVLRDNIEKQFPGVLICGQESPPFRELSARELDEQDERIRTSYADIVWVGLGTPKQDWEVERLAARLPGVFVAVGAAFDFAAGVRKEAPKWVSALCLEWLFRLACEPKRLWRRYLIGNFHFTRAILRESRGA